MRMDRFFVRIQKITLKNFKNVKYGTVLLTNPLKKYKASVLGLYGQNGSGKTALIEAIQILKTLLCGASLPEGSENYINVDSDNAQLIFEFCMNDNDSGYAYIVEYSFGLKRVEVDSSNTMDSSNEQKVYHAAVYNEGIKYSVRKVGEETSRMQTLVDTSSEDISNPKTKFTVLVGNDNELYKRLAIAKALSYEKSLSFVFSNRFMEPVRQNCTEECYKFVLNALIQYGHYGLFTVDTMSSGLISLNEMPLQLRYQNKDEGLAGTIPLSLNHPSVIPVSVYGLINKAIESMNIVLCEIVPGLKIKMSELGTEIGKDGEQVQRVQLVSLKNDKELPLQYESEGIKKIISILQMLIVVYNEPNITVAIDEIDAGIFEYLLGELMKIISEEGRGQLIFTSHNLRPLETINRGFVAFTTTNPDNRYIKLTNIKPTHNLRDFYFRDIQVNEQAEETYEITHNSEISFAFREAGIIANG